MANAKKLMMAAAGGAKRYVYAADYSQKAIRTIDVTDPTSPSVVATLTDATNLNQAYYTAIDLTNNVLFCTADGRRVNAIDISNPLSLSISDTYTFSYGTYDKHEGSIGIDYANERVWLASGSSGDRLSALDYSTPTALSLAGEFQSSTDADRPRNTMYVSSSQGDESDDYVFYCEVDDDSLSAIDVSDISNITFERLRTDATYIGGDLGNIVYDDTNVWMWTSKTTRITAVDMDANGNSIPSGAWSYTSSTTRSGTVSGGGRNIAEGCLAVDESRKYGFTCGTYNVSTWDFSTSGTSKSSSDEYFNESLFFYGLAYDSVNQLLYAVEQDDFFVFDVSDITNITVEGSITGAFTSAGGRGCVLGYDPTA